MWLACASASSGRKRAPRGGRDRSGRRLPDRQTPEFAAFVERQRPLPAAGQLAVDFDQDFRIEQRPVPDALRPIDPITVAQGVEAVWLTGMSLRASARVSTTRSMPIVSRPSLASSALRKRMSNSALWMTSRASPTKAKKSSTIAANTGLSRNRPGSVAVDAVGVLGHLALGVDERVIDPVRRRLVDDLDRPRSRGSVAA